MLHLDEFNHLIDLPRGLFKEISKVYFIFINIKINYLFFSFLLFFFIIIIIIIIILMMMMMNLIHFFLLNLFFIIFLVKTVSLLLSEPKNNETLFITLFTGTAYTSLRELGFSDTNPLVELPMKLLNQKAIESVVESMEKSKYLLWLDGEDWKKNKRFMQCLIDTGGLPRALEYFLEQCSNYSKMPIHKLSQFDFTFIRKATQQALLVKYTGIKDSSTPEIGLRAILGDSVSLKDKPNILISDNSPSFNYEYLNQRGALVLSEAKIQNQDLSKSEESTTKYKINIPMLWMPLYIADFLGSGELLEYQYWNQLMDLSSPEWNNFETICSYIQIIRTNSLRLLKKTSFKFSELFPNTKKNQSFEYEDDIVLQCFKKHRFMKSKYRFLSPNLISDNKQDDWWNTNIVFINGDSAPGIDAFSFYEISNSNTTINKDKEYIGLFLQSKYTKDGKTIFDKNTLIETYNEINELWNKGKKELEKKSSTNINDNNSISYKKANEFMKKVKGYVIVFISNREFNGKNEDIPKNCLLYDKDNLEDLFTIFYSRMKLNENFKGNNL